MRQVVKLSEIGLGDIAEVGGKNASLGELISNLARSEVKVPGGICDYRRSLFRVPESQRPNGPNRRRTQWTGHLRCRSAGEGWCQH